MLLQTASNQPASPLCLPNKSWQRWSNSSSSCKKLRLQLSKPLWTQACPPKASPRPTASMTPLWRATDTTRWQHQLPVQWLLCYHVLLLRVRLPSADSVIVVLLIIFDSLPSFSPRPALAPSSTFAPSASIASPAKLQAAAALAEVANGIEGEVGHFLLGSVDFRVKKTNY